MSNIDELVEDAVNKAIDRAKSVWDSKGKKIFESALTKEALEKYIIKTRIPGYSVVVKDSVAVDDFIAFVVDMRRSSKYLIGIGNEQISGFKHLFFETSVLLAALDVVIDYYKGCITEYLGDGALAIFTCKYKYDIIYSLCAALYILVKLRNFINGRLSIYNYGNISLGIGIAYSKAFVTEIGSENFSQVKVFGENVFCASKLSKGWNSILISKKLFDKIIHYDIGNKFCPEYNITFQKIDNNSYELLAV